MLKVCEIAKKELTVVLSGDGGDELFFGYPRFIQAAEAFELLKASRFLRLFKILSRKAKGFQVPFILMKFKKFDDYYLRKQGIPGSLFWSKRLLKKSLTPRPYWCKFIDNEFSDQEEALQFARQLEFHIHLQRVLLKVDRASMYHSLEVRTPLLSQRLIEYCQNIKFSDCVNNSIGKIPLRYALNEIIPLGASNSGSKKGFSLPLAYWLRTSLKSKIYNRIIDIPLDFRPLINKKAVEELWELHQSGRDLSWMIWSLFSLFDWVDRKMYNIDN
jgi:asparagine synthase (glutamine-hydrolysing)